jgi:hypothetical protein
LTDLAALCSIELDKRFMRLLMRQPGRVKTAERRALSVLAATGAVLLFASSAFGQVRRKGVGPLAADEEISSFRTRPSRPFALP